MHVSNSLPFLIDVLIGNLQHFFQFVPNDWGESTQPTSRSEDSKKKSLRIQDKELKEMVDEAMCLSMHQPWASLLVAGIKRYSLSW